jgi:succinate-semialdehyde dehydrogenase/glutarate-semialdehyde dehydrogenase
MAATDQSHEQSVVEQVPKGLYIAGEWRDASEGGTLAVEDPSTGESIAEVADATVDDAKAALGAGRTRRRASAARSCARPTS